MLKGMIKSLNNRREFYKDLANRNLARVNDICTGSGSVFDEIISLYSKDPKLSRKLFESAINARVYHEKMMLIDDIMNE